MITQRDLIHAYGDWVQAEFINGWQVYYANLMFEPLKGGSNAINSQMRSAIENCFTRNYVGSLIAIRIGRGVIGFYPIWSLFLIYRHSNIRPTPQGLLG